MKIALVAKAMCILVLSLHILNFVNEALVNPMAANLVRQIDQLGEVSSGR
jgi:hypothetical protein